MTKQSIGEFLATLRKANGFTQQEIADKLGVSNRTISAWECGTVLPDILLLPALAELYGVSTDEILSGVRKQTETPAFSQGTEAKLYKNKIARFTMQAYILTGIFAVGLILFYVGMYWHLYAGAYTWIIWRWWLVLLYLGLATSLISATVLIALWKSSEAAVDENDEKCGNFCILLRRRVSLCAYIGAALSLLFTAVTSVFMIDYYHYPLGALFAIMLILSFILFFGGLLLYRRGLSKWGGQNINALLKKDRKFWEKVTLWGLIPLMLGIGVIIFFNFWRQDIKTIYYSSESKTEFTEYMESYEYWYDENPANEITYTFPLSELAETAVAGEEYDLGNNFTCEFSYDKSFCVIYHYYSYDINEKNRSYITVDRISTKDGSYTVYNLRYRQLSVGSTSNNFTGYTFKLETNGEGVQYVLHMYYQYWNYRYFGLGIIVADFFACISICGLKRQKIKIRL